MDHNILDIQRRLVALGHDVAVDGIIGPVTANAILAELPWAKPKGPGQAVTPPAAVPAHQDHDFDLASQHRLKQAHPSLQRLMRTARLVIPFQILDSQRGRAAQEKALHDGHSKAKFGQSAHNWSPSLALDIAPVKLNWNDRKGFLALQEVLGYWDGKDTGHGLALELEIPIRWGGDWDFNDKTAEHFVDLPHYELHPWREFALRGCKPFEG